MLRFAVPAICLAGALLCAAPPVRADDICIGVAVTVGGLQPVGVWPPTCVLVGTTTSCSGQPLDERPLLVVEAYACLPDPTRLGMP